jgi:thymidylate synthase (FAD)
MKEQVLDKGFVELMSSTLDGDLLAVNAARCSFDREHKNLEDKDYKLIDFLAREKHTLPFRHIQVTFRMHLPIFVLRQLGKHQVGFSWSEVSRRYITSEPSFYVPEVIRERPEGNIKQGSGKDFSDDLNSELRVKYINSCEESVKQYNSMITAGVAPEIARGVLPQSMYTTVVVTGSLLGWHHMVTMRTSQHTQFETVQYAKAINSILSSMYYSWSSLRKHIS